MINESTKKSIVQKIVFDTIFDKSGHYKELLLYFLDCSLKGIIPTEMDIAKNVFQKDNSFNPAIDTLVRVYVHKLRKKLEQYYQITGKHEKIRVEISKGRYEIQFIEYDKFKESLWTKIKFKDWIYISIIAVVCIVFYIIYSLSIFKGNIWEIKNLISKDDPIWSTFFNNGLPSTLLIGDHFCYFEYDKKLNRERLLTDWTIASQNQFDEFSKKNPERIIRPQDHGSLPDNSIYNLHDLENVFYSFNQRPEIELSSLFMANEYDFTSIAGRNIIYIGGFKNLRYLNNIFNGLPVEFKYTELWKGELSVKDSRTDSTIVFKCQEIVRDKYFLDYGLIAKIPGDKNGNYMIITGFAYPSQIATVRMLSKPSLLEKIINHVKKTQDRFPEYFFMIIEFKGSHFSATESKIVYWSELKQPQN